MAKETAPTNTELRKELRQLGLQSDGDRPTLLKRLADHQENQRVAIMPVTGPAAAPPVTASESTPLVTEPQQEEGTDSASADSAEEPKPLVEETAPTDGIPSAVKAHLEAGHLVGHLDPLNAVFGPDTKEEREYAARLYGKQLKFFWNDRDGTPV